MRVINLEIAKRNVFKTASLSSLMSVSLLSLTVIFYNLVELNGDAGILVYGFGFYGFVLIKAVNFSMVPGYCKVKVCSFST